MTRFAAAILIASIGLASLAQAEDVDRTHPTTITPKPDTRNIVVPNRYAPSSKLPSAADEQKMLNYRAQLQAQQRELEQLQMQNRLGPAGRNTLMDTQMELNRLNSTLRP